MTTMYLPWDIKFYGSIFGKRKRRRKWRTETFDGSDMVQSAEGAALRKVYGNEVKVAGHVIWMSEVTSSFVADSARYNTVDIAVAWCHGAVDGIEQIWAGDLAVYDELAADLVKTSSDIIIDTPSGSSPSTTIMLKFDVEDDTWGVGWKVGRNVAVTGATNAGNNDDWTIRSLYDYYDSDDDVTYNVIFAENFGGAAVPESGATITVTQETPDWTDITATGQPGFTDIENHLGAVGQAQSTIISDIDGTEYTPHYSGVTYTVFEGFKLWAFGNRVPEFSARLQDASSPSVAQIIEDVCDDVGFDVSGVGKEVDTDDVDLEFFRGLALNDLWTGAEALREIMDVHNVIASEAGNGFEGVMTFKSRVNQDVISADADDLGARAPGQAPRDGLLTHLTEAETEGPTSNLTLNYIDADNRFERSSVVSRINRIIPGTSPPEWDERQNDETVDTDSVLFAGEAHTLVKELHIRREAMRQRVRFYLPPSYVLMQAGDRLDVTVEGEDFRIHVDAIDIGYNELRVCDGRIIEANVD